MSTPERMEIRSAIKFFAELGHTPPETCRMIRKKPVRNNVSRALVFKWFSEGRENINDDEGRGRKMIITPTLVTSVLQMLNEDRRFTTCALCDVGYGTMQKILTKDLNMSKVHARWVPRLLKDFEKARRVRESQSFLRGYGREGDNFLSRIITIIRTYYRQWCENVFEQWVERHRRCIQYHCEYFEKF